MPKKEYNFARYLASRDLYFDAIPKKLDKETGLIVRLNDVLDSLGFTATEKEIIGLRIINSMPLDYTRRKSSCSFEKLKEEWNVHPNTLRKLFSKRAFKESIEITRDSECFYYDFAPLMQQLVDFKPDPAKYRQLESAESLDDEPLDELENQPLDEFESNHQLEEEVESDVAVPPVESTMSKKPTEFKPEISTVKVNPRSLMDEELASAAIETVHCFNDVAKWFFRDVPTSSVWYRDLLEDDTSPNGEDIKSRLWYQLETMQTLLNERPEDQELGLHRLAIISSWFVERRTINNVDHALGDEDTWKAALSLWHRLSCNLSELRSVKRYMETLYNTCLDNNIRLAGEVLIPLGKQYQANENLRAGLSNDKSFNEKTKIEEGAEATVLPQATAAWLYDLYLKGKDVESNLKELDDGSFFASWCHLKINKLQEANFAKIYPANFTKYAYDPDDKALTELAKRLGRVGKDNWGEIRKFLGLNPLCEIVWLPKGWRVAPYHIKQGGKTEDITKIDGPAYYVGSKRYLTCFHHEIDDVLYAVSVTPENFQKYKATWNDKTLDAAYPTLTEMTEDGYSRSSFDVAGKFKKDPQRIVPWRTE